MRVGNVFVPVTNLERSITWYSECLNLKLIAKWNGGEGASFSLPAGNVGLDLVKVAKKQRVEFKIAENRYNCYYNFIPEDIYDMHRRLVKKGVKVTDVVDHGPIIGFDFFDPDDNPFSVVWEKPESPLYKPFE